MKNVYKILVETNEKNEKGEYIWMPLDMGKDKLYWNVQVNDIAELNDRNASGSRSIKFPPTYNNCMIFESANIQNVVTNVPYRRMNCRVYCGASTLSGKGSYLRIIRIDRDGMFECQIASGLASLFNTLKGLNMKDLDLGTFQIVNSSLNPDNWPKDGIWKVPIGANYSKKLDKKKTKLTSITGDNRVYDYIPGLGASYPVISIEKTLQRILAAQGFEKYVLDGVEYLIGADNQNILTDKYFSLAKVEMEKEKGEEDVYDYSMFYVRATCRMGTFLEPIYTEPIVGLRSVITENDRLRYYVPAAGTVRLDFISGIGHSGTNVYIEIDGEIVREYNMQNYRESTDSFELTTNNSYIEVFYTTDNLGLTTFSFELSITEATPSNIGETLKLSECTSFEKQSDFFNAFMQTFALTPNVNDIKKEARFFTFDYLYDNKRNGNVLNWSEKVDYKRNPELEFTINNYAQINSITYEDNSPDDIKDKGTFTVDNWTLDQERNLFNVGFEAGRNVLLNYGGDGDSGYDVMESNQVPLLSIGEIPVGTDKKIQGFVAFGGSSLNEITSHLMILSDETYNITPVTNLPEPKTYKWPNSKYLSAQELVSTYYALLSGRLLNRAKLIKDYILLSPEDLEKFNPEIPVYIQKYGRYFYVNKIKNYQYGKLTECELIKL